ncbi:phenylalanyl-tRNA synthetase subunit beta [Actinoplanes sp. SE50]|uniref:phenylalanine--tRNA ligase subunit beta n=1 Tax=unclassified Actinoplanes TaxID=2626549 RepID=UPI00023ED4DE|nr:MULTISPECIES: phenylalanine--tRNA ligase subunit beta [unclassified Actinoplanes]AEV87323.1 phenylalanyl-tRNA synthetase subunit beta [Actinoplanes sp. SE50/110]ATO85723.1 phenylalanyl-tRNA synthetase subunit beta [Actinoplanes sp. SE50]SLM03136.1 phenylalanine--tRNA ligase subunit beta [Actinoplanes sp. SE50/110]
MKTSLSWLREYVDLPAGLTAERLDLALNTLGMEVESIVDQAATVQGDLVVGRVLTIEELTGFKKPIRFCTVDVGRDAPQEIVCGARNFAEGDLVVVILPGGELPGGFRIGARKTYGRNSHGMICSAAELGLSGDHSGIIVLPAGTPGADARPVVGLDDVLVEVEITPDRGYEMSVRGIARELATHFGVAYRDPAAIPAAAATGDSPWPVTVEDTVGCDRFSARVVRGIDPQAQSPEWMQRRLIQAGIRAISLPVDITNYLMLEFGQPMHVFDLQRLRGGLTVRRARAGEKLTTLDGVARILDAEDMVICDETGPISLAAVMGGETSEWQPGTVDVLLEAAHWDPVMVGRTARRHRLFSEAAKRWERGVDPQLTLPALERAVAILLEHAGGTADERILDLDHVAPPAAIHLPAELPSKVIGLPYPPDRIAELLTAAGCTVAGSDVVPPSWRPDLQAPIDLVEEVARLGGYHDIPSVLPPAGASNGLTPGQRRRRSVGRALAENGYVEVLSYPFVAPGAADQLGLPADDPRRSAVRLTNPLSEEEPLLRTNLLGPLLGTLKRNLGRGHRDVALFETGTVFLPRLTAEAPPVLGVDRRPDADEWARANAIVPDQPWHLAAVLTGDAAPAGWWGEGRPASWADAIEAARIAIAAAGVPAARVGVRAAEQAPWHPGRCAAILVDGEVVGHAGELHPAVVSALELPKRTSAMELSLDALPDAPVVDAPLISTFPPALIDVALVLDRTVPADEVRAALAEGAGSLLESVALFDVYESAQLGEGKRSLAYKLTFRAPDRTLTSDETIAARDAAVAVTTARFGATLRGA